MEGGRPGNGHAHEEERAAHEQEHEHDEHDREEHERDEHERDERHEKREPLRRRIVGWRRRHPRGAIALVVVVALLLVAAVLVWWHYHTHESTDDAQIDGHIAPVSTRVAGTITRVYVDDNDLVKAGQLLAEIDPRDYDVALARAQAELAQAQAQLAAESPSVPITETSSSTQIATTSEDVDAARAALAGAERDYQAALGRVHSAEANDARAQADLTRYKYLLGQRAITAERFDQVVATAKASRADLESQRALARSAQKNVEQQRNKVSQALSRHGEIDRNAPRQLSIRQATLEARQAAVKAAQAAVARAQLDLSYCKITAPFGGVVGKRSVEPGQRVQPGEQLLAVVDLDDLWVTANFKETQLEKLRVGQPVRIKVDAFGIKIDGTVESFAGASGARYSLLPPENATGNYVKVVQRLPVRIRIAPNQDPDHRLRPGLSVEPTVSLQ